MKTLSEVKKHIDSFSRPSGYNNYAWEVTKKIAMEVWRCHFENKMYYRPVNFLCPEFYHMVTTEEGKSLIPYKSIA